MGPSYEEGLAMSRYIGYKFVCQKQKVLAELVAWHEDRDSQRRLALASL